MTPIQALNYRPDEVVISHETGHMLGAMKLGIVGSCIEFPGDRTRHQGRHWANSESAPVEDVIRMILSGPIIQALVHPNSLNPEFRMRLVSGDLFSSAACLEEDSVEEIEMKHYGFSGDWENIKRKLEFVSRASGSELAVLKCAHQLAIDDCKDAVAQGLLAATVADVRAWLEEDNESVADRQRLGIPMIYLADRAARAQNQATGRSLGTAARPGSSNPFPSDGPDGSQMHPSSDEGRDSRPNGNH